jgi:hypothetical protein
MTLGRLQRVELRDTWASEAQDFTPWLAEENNITLLSEALGIALEVEATEKPVGPFRADILCKDTADGSWVMIENQLERTDHRHLGQVLTYASGLEAATIIWIAERFTDEHRSTLDWLNSITEDGFSFFGLEVELWKIGDSRVAPKFNIVSKPNEWSRDIRRAAQKIKTEPQSPTQQVQIDYWTQFSERLEATSTIRPRKPRPQHYMNFSIGRSIGMLGALIVIREQWIGVELYLNDLNATKFFHLLISEKSAIEAELGFGLIWDELPDKQASRIYSKLLDVPVGDEMRWIEYSDWMIGRLEKFDAVFRERVRNLNLEDYDEGIDQHD